ncbi:transporter substrate-binding domain-containing protein [Vibrio pectenicida]|uniref:Transporter substrate-binding domain-containing protein n=1 Tax=Vibrio pectenicida TaxID=62763 RepID=A0A7Y3ZY67_9VIBR|nr:transporter substrate-binding domain-containing protein [Vibrio pectenicida]NOH71230.1 transporter substrate-binding domain-containing protein [Vibrio pectenicida]
MTRIQLVLICTLIALSSKAYASNHLQQVKICLGDDSPLAPYTIWDEKLPEVKAVDITGILPDLAQEVFSKTRYEYVISPMPWSRVIRNMQSKDSECDVALSASFKQERVEFMYYAFPLYKFSIGYFYTGSDSVWVDLSNINKNKACGIVGYNYEHFNYKNEINLVDSTSKALSLLSKNRCQIFLSEIEPILYGMEKGLYQIDQKIYDSQDNLLYKVTDEKAYYLIVNKQTHNAEAILADLNQRLTEVQQNGTFDAIKSKYLKKL